QSEAVAPREEAAQVPGVHDVEVRRALGSGEGRLFDDDLGHRVVRGALDRAGPGELARARRDGEAEQMHLLVRVDALTEARARVPAEVPARDDWREGQVLGDLDDVGATRTARGNREQGGERDQS